MGREAKIILFKRGGYATMDKGKTDIKDTLKKENHEFSQLMKEHEVLEGKLDELNKLKFLTPDQEIEKKRIQKLKLKGKDKMAAMIREFESKK